MAQKAFNVEDKQKLEELFQTLDINNDGQLQKSELVIGYTELYGDAEIANKEVERIFKNVDINHNNAIDFSEFLMANMQKENIMQDEKLKEAFAAFDTDRNGSISLEELEGVFQLPLGSDRDKQKKELNKLFQFIDSNGDGCIDFTEFVQMMQGMHL